ncbi:amino acid ABC transporter permease [Helicobacter sp. 11S02629-2]|uniref:amino acid ABC transporter permease n=1 Tax=Helicobacter sp. 11S02629-2 TaxID=1476195 RepID=UPI000BA75B1F|nr:amino acid ABC transporter permease [Helicobacter sp. 11S02629-2]PAF42153.1 amino acid ABC transporter permease [Helicobacter sp. 11S02629-2]
MGPFALDKWIDTFNHINVFLSGFAYTLGVSILAIIIAIIMGTISGLMATGKIRILRWIARIYVEFFQNTPLLINLFFLYFVLPRIPYIGVTLDVFTLGVIGVGVYHGAYMSEVIRSGITSIPKGQFEASYTQGFNYFQKMFYVILPQTKKIILPPTVNQIVALIKNTSVLAIISGAELMYNADNYAQSSLNYATAYLVAGVLYFIVCFIIAYFAGRYENKLKKAHMAR